MWGGGSCAGCGMRHWDAAATLRGGGAGAGRGKTAPVTCRSGVGVCADSALCHGTRPSLAHPEHTSRPLPAGGDGPARRKAAAVRGTAVPGPCLGCPVPPAVGQGSPGTQASRAAARGGPGASCRDRGAETWGAGAMDVVLRCGARLIRAYLSDGAQRRLVRFPADSAGTGFSPGRPGVFQPVPDRR